MSLLTKRLMFWMRESVLRAKFRLYERWPALFPHALDMDENDAESLEDIADEALLELRYQEHRAAEPTLEPRRTMIFSSYNSQKRCNFLTAKYYRWLIAKNLQWALDRGFTNVLVDYTTPYGLLALETLLPLKTDGAKFHLYCMKSCFFSERRSFRLVPETNVEIAFLTRECDYTFSQYLPHETLSKIFAYAGALCSEDGLTISPKWIPKHLRDVW